MNKLKTAITRLRFELAQRKVVRIGCMKFQIAESAISERRAVREAAEARCREIESEARVLEERLSHELDKACRERQALKDALGMGPARSPRVIGIGEAYANAADGMGA